MTLNQENALESLIYLLEKELVRLSMITSGVIISREDITKDLVKFSREHSTLVSQFLADYIKTTPDSGKFLTGLREKEA